MSQYRDPFIGRGEVSGGSSGGSGSRNRRNNEEYMYQRREEDDGSQYSPSSEYSSIHGFPAVPTDMGSRSSARPIQQPPRRPQQPMSSRQGGNGGQQSFPIPPVPRTPGNNNSNGSRGPPPPRPVRRDYVPSNLDSSEVQEVQQNPNFSYRLNQQPVRTQTRYSQQSDDEHSPISPAKPPTNRPSASSSRSIFIGFDPSNPPPTDPNSLGVIPNFPSVPPASGSNRKSSGTGPPPSARRGTSSYYSQQALMVSPIPEESSGSDRHGSYASSTAIPSNWAAPEEVEEYYTNRRNDVHSDSDESDSRFPEETFHDVGEERGLVRQASLGRKSRPVITEIKSSGGGKLAAASSKSSSESFKTGRSASGSVSAGRGTSRSPAEKSSPTLNPVVGGSGASLPYLPSPQAQSPVSSSTESDSPIITPPLAYTPGDYMSERLSFPRRASQSSSPAYELQPTAGTAPRAPPPAAGGLAGRRIPPRLNLDAVREAEARGSLTSLPDLIRRATKLAAVLETGRPDSRWGGRGASYMDSSSGGRSRDTDSISDILASFPPPVLAQGKNRNSRTLSQWPLPGDFTHENESSIRPSKKQGRRVCGLPLWAFVLLVILALLVICAAVIVPLQLVNLSKSDKNGNNDSGRALVAECKEKNPCQNGGENIATSDFCGCVCTNGFTGSDCTQMADSSCTTVDLKDRNGGRIKGIQNVTMGNALPRLFDIADPYYNIELDMAMLLAVFSNESISCTAQNALVTFNGEAIPDSATTTTAKRELEAAIAELEKRQTAIVTDTATSTAAAATTTATGTSSTDSRTVELDSDAIDFARVAVLYLTNAQTLTIASEAQSQLQAYFTAGRDFGDLSVGNNITVDFDNRSIELSNGSIIGSAAANSTNTTTATETASAKIKRTMESYFVA
ncbi:uncharacterized protein LAJ45_06689 [Morchella importuna]|uniref:uncharacterized protein n=1 Tax=Morchella importuna TaxID=1174673 RepID=UPI001E8D2A08|nr:uncharacterized protein LAJ45_06689 [Morchella importuna]KAH8149150.1 hypothetical protein LAJ45_06689 [Morchella importuna]